jgi:WD40 repeat protein
VRLWDADTQQQIGAPLVGHQGAVVNVTFSPDGHRLASGGFDKTIRFWDADTGKPVGDPITGPDGGVAVMLSRDGRRVVGVSNDHTIRVWDATVGQPLVGHTSGVSTCGVQPRRHTHRIGKLQDSAIVEHADPTTCR